ncbi:MAG: iron ABC transporter permease [Chloroflexi bacterium]|nr:iron ABC transporter permease [Chloroflexota bacterium]
MSATRPIARTRAPFQPLSSLRLPRFSLELVVLGLCAIAVVLLVMIPILTVVNETFRAEVDFGPSWYTLANFQFLVSPRILSALSTTFIVAIGGTLLSGVLGIALALIIARTDTPFRGVLEFLVMVPFFLSPYIGALAWSFLGSPQIGLLNGLWKGITGSQAPLLSVYNYGGMIWVLGLFFTPYFYLFVLAPLRRMDTTLEEAARICGCKHLEIARKVTIPLVLPAILSAALLTFVSCAGEFGVPLALGSPYGMDTLSTQIYMLMNDSPPRFNSAAATGSVLLLLALILIYVQRRIIAPRDYTTVTGKATSARVLPLGRLKYVTLAFVLLYVLLAVILPMVTLFLLGFSRIWRGSIDPNLFTPDNFLWLASSPVATRGLLNSFILALVGATLAMVLGTLLAWIIFRSRAPGRGLLDFISTIPVGVAGIVMAVGILVAYLRTPLYGTWPLALLCVGYISRYLPTAQRTVSGTILALSHDLDESARTAGASWWTVMRRIIVPLLMPGIISGWMLMFVVFLREFPISILLYRQGTEVLSIAIWNVLRDEGVSRSAALMFVQFVLVMVCLVVFRRTIGRDSLS